MDDTRQSRMLVSDGEDASDTPDSSGKPVPRVPHSVFRVGSLVCLVAAAALALLHLLPVREAPTLDAPPVGRVRGSVVPLANYVAVEAPRKTRVFILLMGMDSIPHADIWKAFFEREPVESYGFLIHCKDERMCKDQLAATGLDAFGEVVPTVFNAWCKDLVSPMLQLLKYALAREPAPGYPVEKFAFVSTQHLPVKPLRVISEELGKRPDESDFCVHRSTWWLPMKTANTTQAVTCYQWSVLSKRDAVTLRQRMPDPSPSVPLAVPKVGGFGFEDTTQVHCIDEAWIFATLYGLVHVPTNLSGWNQAELDLPGFGKLWYPAWRPEGRCVYFGTEGYLPRAVSAAQYDRDHQAQAALALRSVGDSIYDNPATHCLIPGDPYSCEVIWVISSLGPRGQRLLRNSSYLFARKFADTAILTGYASVVFA